MKSKTKKSLLFVASSLAAVVLAGGVGAMTQAVAQAEETSATTFEMIDGASIRTTDPTGIRFQVKLGSQYYNALTEANATSELHVALIPYSYYEAYKADNQKGTQALYPWLVNAYGASNILEVEIPSEKIYYTTDEETNESYYCANAVISNVYFNNYHVDFVGVAYIENNNVYTDTTNVDEEDNARSIFEVACKASEDKEVYEKNKTFLDATVEKAMYYAYGVRQNNTTGKYTFGGTSYDTYEEVKSATGITVSETQVTLDDVVMDVSETKALNATVSFSNTTAYEKDAHFTWKIEDETIASIDANGVVTPKAGGQTTVTVTAFGGRFTDTCTLTVRQDIVTKYEFLAKGDAGITASNTGNANIELSDTQINAGEITQVLCGGTPVTFTVNGTVLTLTDAPAGDQVYTIVTPFVDYTVNACVYGYSISDKAEFLAWREAVNTTSGFKAYTILTANINLAGETLSAISTLNCVLDGRGYAIANFTLNECSLSTVVDTTGAYKNLQIIGATQTWGTKGGTHGIFAQQMYGTIEDVYVQATITGLTDVWYSAVLVYGGNSLSTLKNIIADITVEGTHTYYAAGVNWGESAKIMDNVHMLVNSAGAVASGSSSTNSGTYSSMTDLINATKHFASPWIVKEGQVPYLREKQTVVVNGVFLAKGDAEITAMDTGNAVLDLSQTAVMASSITKVLCNGENVAFSASANSLTLKGAPAGENTYTLVGALENYTVKVCVYGYAISNKAEFITWRNSAEDIRAYTILTADIDLDGESFNSANRDLACILDGREYSIANFTLNECSLFTNVYGGYKNLQIIGATQTWGAKGGTHGIFAQQMYGTIEDVYVQATITGLTDVGYSAVLVYGGNSLSTLKNIIADITVEGTHTYYAAGVNWGESAKIMDNVHMLVNSAGAVASGSSSTNSGTYSSMTDLINATKHFASPWIVEDGKVPYLSDYSRFLNNN